MRSEFRIHWVFVDETYRRAAYLRRKMNLYGSSSMNANQDTVSPEVMGRCTMETNPKTVSSVCARRRRVLLSATKPNCRFPFNSAFWLS
ncbi:Hypothetical protein SMAX5B_002426 [Scophthalmus maximus]|uniref:Uncharacterized protein n=1 Tax=Scophthalmus maximus TaxID=52904 RepID=A0A2U9AVX3_SCOMX|nr:Hypothetical protein SMAX5B_002426 [Scophthalmus maximus]